MDARTSRYHEVYRALAARPGRLLGRGRRARSTGSSRPRRVFDPSAGVYGRWFVGGVCNTCCNAVDRHVDGRARRRSRRSSTIRRSPARSAPSPTPPADRDAGARRHAARLRRREGRPRHPLHADGAGGGDRACSPARASAPSIRWCSAASPRKELATRIDDAKPEADPVGDLRHRARPRRRTTSRCSTRRSTLAQHKPDACIILQRPQAEAPLVAGRDHDWGSLREKALAARKSASSACRSPPPIRSTSSTPRARPAARRAWCATMAATWSRSNGR